MTVKTGIVSIRSLKEINRVERFIEEILDYHNIPGEYFGNILLAVTEAATLSLKNGEEVTIAMSKSRKGIAFSLTRNHIADIELDELDRAIAQHAFARETFIIRSLADEAEFIKEGNIILLQFYITGVNLERSLLRSDKLKSYLARKEKVVDRNEG
ncbi:MAG: hypothetical protein JXA23_05040 [Bacteroidales bacterium]|nr:hypothetical protein [Bacteroidales bacterium]